MYEKAEKDALADHEWLEVLLYGVIPRRDTNEIAHRLLKRFGSVTGIFFASMEDLQTIEGVGVSVASHIRAIGHFFEKYGNEKALLYRESFTCKSFMAYVKAAYKEVGIEVADVYLLDGEGYVMKKRRFSIDKEGEVNIPPNEFTSFITAEGVAGIVVAHNHPYGHAEPSNADDRLTKNCQMLCSINNRLFCDHMIYAPDGVFSYYASGKLALLSREYAVSNLLGKDNER